MNHHKCVQRLQRVTDKLLDEVKENRNRLLNEFQENINKWRNEIRMIIQDMKMEFNKEKTMKKTQTEMKRYQDSVSQIKKNSGESLTNRMDHEHRIQNVGVSRQDKGIESKKQTFKPIK